MARLGDDSTAMQMVLDGNERVWFSYKDEAPSCSGLTVNEFFDSPLFRRAEIVRVSGSHSFAGIVVNLYGRVLSNALRAVQVCSPVMIRRAVPSGDSVASLCAMRLCRSAPSCGGWYDVNEVQCPSYILTDLLYNCRDRADNDENHQKAIAFCLRQHPSWRALSFIPTLDDNKTALLLASALDPRFFVDANDPDSYENWYNFFGLNSRKALSSGDGFDQTTTRGRLNLIKHCWRKSKTVPNKHQLQLPGNFLWRRWLLQAKTKGSEHADLETARLFVTYLRDVWLDAIYGANPPWGERLFVPELFFDTPSTASAWCEADGSKKK